MIKMMKRSSTQYRIPTSPLQILLAFGVVLALIYTGLVALPLLQGPSLAVEGLQTTPSGTTVIIGTTMRVPALTINNLPVPINEVGYFTVERVFPSGYTVVVLEAHDRFKRVRTEQLTFITHATHKHEAQEINEKSSSQESN